MDAVRCLLDRLRPLVGLTTWDYCVLWKLSEDQRFIEWVGCCCGGVGAVDDLGSYSQNVESGEELVFSVSAVHPCRDSIFQHPRAKSCHLLSILPSSMPLDSRSHGQAILDNQPRWINHQNSPDSCVSEETIGTRILIPVSGGLVEFFASKPVPENPYIIEFVIAQCNVSWEQEAIKTSDADILGIGFAVHENNHPKHLALDGFTTEVKNGTNPCVSQQITPWDLSLDQNRQLCNPPMNFLGGGLEQQMENQYQHEVGFQGSNESILSAKQTPAFNSLEEHHDFPEFGPLHHQPFVSDSNNIHPSMEIHSCVTKEPEHEKDSVKHEMGKTDSASDCSDQMEDDDDQKAVGRGGRRHQSKNLMAERKRRKKLNDRLYTLRSLVPRITKMDRASILGDAIDYVKELQKQVKDLQDELEEPLPEEDSDKNTGHDNIANQNEHGESLKGTIEQGTHCSSNGKIPHSKKRTQDFMMAEDKTPQMEVQVEVNPIDGNEYYVKVFCEHKQGGFVRLMEAMNSLGLEVTNANVTTCRDLVLNVFRVEKRDNEMVQAEQVRDSLLELTQNPMGGSESLVQAPGKGSSLNYHHHHHQHTHHNQNHDHNMNSHNHHHNLRSLNHQA